MATDNIHSEALEGARPASRPEIDSLTFEQAQAELEQVVEALEDQHTGLDEALELWERGEALHAYCQRKLDHAAARMQKLTVGADEVAAVTAADAAAFDPVVGEPLRESEQPAPSIVPTGEPSSDSAAVPTDEPPSIF